MKLFVLALLALSCVQLATSNQYPDFGPGDIDPSEPGVWGPYQSEGDPSSRYFSVGGHFNYTPRMYYPSASTWQRYYETPEGRQELDQFRVKNQYGKGRQLPRDMPLLWENDNKWQPGPNDPLWTQDEQIPFPPPTQKGKGRLRPRPMPRPIPMPILPPMPRPGKNGNGRQRPDPMQIDPPYDENFGPDPNDYYDQQGPIDQTWIPDEQNRFPFPTKNGRPGPSKGSNNKRPGKGRPSKNKKRGSKYFQ